LLDLALGIGGLLFSIWVVAAVWAGAWVRAFRAPSGVPWEVITSDGWTLHVHRYPPQGAPRGGPPVILGHGFMMNQWCWSLSEAGSLPIALSRRGHDVYVAEYRGSGASANPPAKGHERRGGGLDGWRFGDHVQFDLPAIIDGVRAISGSETVHWVGHSMGGMAGYSYALKTGGGKLASLVTIGSPARFGHIKGLFGPTGPLALRLLRKVHLLRVRLLVKLLLPFTAIAPTLSMRTSGPAHYLSLGERFTLMAEAFANTSPALTGFFVDLGENDRRLISSEPGEPSFRDLTVPTLILGGVNDVLAPPTAHRVPFDEAQPGRVAYRLFGDPSLPDGEAGPGLGHADLISGETAIQYVLPVLARWLEADAPLRLPEFRTNPDKSPHMKAV